MPQVRRHRRVIGYARVSSAEQALGTSLGDQQAAITAHTKACGMNVSRMYVEAESAVHEKIERREQIRALMADVREGDLVLCHRLDRWSRDPEFSYRSIREILAAGASFYAIDDRCDPSTSEGDTALGFRIMFAREEHKRIKARMVGTRRLLRDRGYYVDGLAPHGYRRQNAKGAERNVLVIVPDEAATVRKVFALCIAGRSTRELADATGLTRDVVNSILRSRSYCGEIKNTAGEWIRAKHPPIIDRDTFERAQGAVKGRRLGRSHNKSDTSRTATWLLREVARCGLCGAGMIAVYGTRIDYYRCRRKCAGARHVRQADADAAVLPMILGRLLALRVELAAEPGRKAPVAPTDTTAKRVKLDARRARLLDAYADGSMTKEELRGRLDAVDAERARLDATDRDAARRSPLESPAIRAATLAQVDAIEAAWAILTPIHRRRLATLLLSVVKLAYGHPPTPQWRSASELAEEWSVK